MENGKTKAELNGEYGAFASPGTYNPNNGNHNGDQQIGLSKREYFAGLAMQGLLASPNFRYNGSGASITIQVAVSSIKYADELLKQLEA